MKTAIVIPARLASMRLQNKPLAMIGAKPMIALVAEQARRSGVGDVFIACCGKEIADVARNHGFSYILTEPSLPSGTDRVFYGVKSLEERGHTRYDFIINVQGDMPFISPHVIEKTLDALQKNSAADIATPITDIWNDGELDSPHVVKAIISDVSKHALYFTRAAVVEAYKHLGVYAYRRDSLERFVHLPIGALEKAERLEQLRALENGMKIMCVLVKDDPISVDTGEDLERARQFFLTL